MIPDRRRILRRVRAAEAMRAHLDDALAARKAMRQLRSAAAYKGHLTRRAGRNKAAIVGPAARA